MTDESFRTIDVRLRVRLKPVSKGSREMRRARLEATLIEWGLKGLIAALEANRYLVDKVTEATYMCERSDDRGKFGGSLL
ncbi:MAG TPA: hypothetical protein VFK41_08935 [Nocardioidaceae bacterium]|nr:hypothetical protein [Nocardioidaceae bacterium]